MKNNPVLKELKTIHKSDPAFPKRMEHLPKMPETLYLLGELPSDNLPSVAIIGARMCSGYGHETAYQFGHALAEHGIQIISGMATGIDGYGMRGALDAGGRVFGVLGSGVDVCYPACNVDLYTKVQKQGGILSEQPPGSQPLKAFFPQRNRIISALADILLVVEAKPKSGTRTTIEAALDQGKTVFAIPGRIGDPLSDSCNRLIEEGAGIACSPMSIIHELQLKYPSLAEEPSVSGSVRNIDAVIENHPALSDTAKRLFKVLSPTTPMTAEELSYLLSLPQSQTSAAIIELQLYDFIRETGRARYIAIRPI